MRSKLNIVVPMAGRGSRFEDAGYRLPKPLLPVRDRPMIQFVIENLRPLTTHRFTFICQKEHLERYELAALIESITPGSNVIAVDQVTEGAACTVLLAQQFIDNEQPLMIANCDQYVAVSIDNYLAHAEYYDGFIMTMTADDPKWSFIKIGENGAVMEVVEKKVISTEATVGIYNYARGGDFVRGAKAMITANDRVNGEFYVAPTYNYLIRDSARIGFMNIGSDRNGMYGLGVPNDLEYFNSLPEIPVG